MDVGCGKGVFLREAAKEPFGRGAGIEYSEKMADIAKRNFKRYFNPFDSDFMTKVVKRIVDSQKETNWIILHNPTCSKVISDFGGKEICHLHDNVKSYDTIIYELEKK